MGYKVNDEVLIKVRIKDMSYVDMMYVCELITNPDVCIRFKSPAECIFAEKTYSDGLNDAWELARKIVMGEEDGGFDSQEVIDVFGKSRYYSFKDFTAEEALAKIESYEKEKEIKVNDIVKVKGERGLGIVTAVCPTGIIYVLWDDGGCGDYEPCELEKTGRTAEGLADLLRQIKE